MAELIEKLKVDIIEQLNLEDVQASDIKEDEPLFGGSIGLDSIDALELIVLLEKKYGVKIDNPDEGREIFYSVKTIADYIEKKKK